MPAVPLVLIGVLPWKEWPWILTSQKSVVEVKHHDYNPTKTELKADMRIDATLGKPGEERHAECDGA